MEATTFVFELIYDTIVKEKTDYLTYTLNMIKINVVDQANFYVKNKSVVKSANMIY